MDKKILVLALLLIFFLNPASGQVPELDPDCVIIDSITFKASNGTVVLGSPEDPLYHGSQYDIIVEYGCNVGVFDLHAPQLYYKQGALEVEIPLNCGIGICACAVAPCTCSSVNSYVIPSTNSFELKLTASGTVGPADVQADPCSATTGTVYNVQPHGGGGGGSEEPATTAPMTTTTTTTTLSPAGQYFLPEQSFKCESVTEGFPGCVHDFSCTDSAELHPIVRCSGCEDCMAECAKACGSQTTCLAEADTTCEECCQDETCKNYAPYDWIGCLMPLGAEAKEVCSCMKSCTGSCEANTEFCAVIQLLRIIAGIAAVALLGIHGLRLIMTTEPEGRKDAKQGILYVIIGTLIILLASGLVSYFYVGNLLC